MPECRGGIGQVGREAHACRLEKARAVGLSQQVPRLGDAAREEAPAGRPGGEGQGKRKAVRQALLRRRLGDQEDAAPMRVRQ